MKDEMLTTLSVVPQQKYIYEMHVKNVIIFFLI